MRIVKRMTLQDAVGKNGLFCDGDWIETKDQDPNGEVRLIQLADIGDGVFNDKSDRFITDQKAQELSCTFLKKWDILIARLPDPLGRACIFPFSGKFITAVDIAIVRIRDDSVSASFIMYLINSLYFRNEVRKYESGTTRKRISRKNLARIEFNIPPLPEQERIVARIEELFSELDKAVETLQTTKQQLAVYRQAVLKEMFENISEYRTLDDITERIFDGPFGTHLKTADYESCGIRVVRLENIKNLAFDNSKQSFVAEEKYQTIERHTVFQNDIIMSTFIADEVKVCQLPKDVSFAVNKADCVGIRVKKEYYAKYVLYYLASKKVYQELLLLVHGATRPRVNTTQIKSIRVPYCTTQKQRGIVTTIESRLPVCDSIELTVNTALAQADAMRQSILKEAFEGRLA